MPRSPDEYPNLTQAIFHLLQDHVLAAGRVTDPRSHLQDCIGCTLSEAQELVDDLTSLLSSGAAPTGGYEETSADPACGVAQSRSAAIRRARQATRAANPAKAPSKATILKKLDILLDDMPGQIVRWLVDHLRSLPKSADGADLDAQLKTISCALGHAIAAYRNRYQERLTAFIAGLEQSAPVSFLLDETGEIVAATPMADALDNSYSVFASSGRLRINSAAMRPRLDAAIAKISAQTKAGKHDAEVLLLEPSEEVPDVHDFEAVTDGAEDRSTKRRSPDSLTIRSLPLLLAPIAADIGCRQATCWISLRGRELMDAPNIAWLRTVLNLSKSEAPLVRALMQGVSVTEHAKARGVTVDAEHAHLKSVFRKVGCHGQNDLILTISTLHGQSFKRPRAKASSGAHATVADSHHSSEE